MNLARVHNVAAVVHEITSRCEGRRIRHVLENVVIDKEVRASVAARHYYTVEVIATVHSVVVDRYVIPASRGVHV